VSTIICDAPGQCSATLYSVSTLTITSATVTYNYTCGLDPLLHCTLGVSVPPFAILALNLADGEKLNTVDTDDPEDAPACEQPFLQVSAWITWSNGDVTVYDSPLTPKPVSTSPCP
jgi:hypothetical protein